MYISVGQKDRVLLKSVYSKIATKKLPTQIWSLHTYLVNVKFKGMIFSDFLAFSENLNFILFFFKPRTCSNIFSPDLKFNFTNFRYIILINQLNTLHLKFMLGLTSVYNAVGFKKKSSNFAVPSIDTVISQILYNLISNKYTTRSQ